MGVLPMAQPRAQPIVQPVAQPAGQAARPPINIEINLEGNPLLSREIRDLQGLCADKHAQKGRVITALLGLASLVAAIWIGMAAGSWLVGIAIFFVGGNAVESIYNNLRNRDYVDASQALATPSFRLYVERHNLDLSIDSIIGIYKNYKRHLAHLNNEWPNGLPAIPERV